MMILIRFMHLFLLHLLLLFFYISSTTALWPIPTEYVAGTSVLWIDTTAQFRYTVGHEVILNNSTVRVEIQLLMFTLNQPSHYANFTHSTSASSALVESAIARAVDVILNRSLFPWKFHPRNSNFEPVLDTNKTSIQQVFLTQYGVVDSQSYIKPLAGKVDESYTLDVAGNGTVYITARSSNGLLYGLETFSQLFYKHSEGGVYTPYAPVHIVDKPKFSHRGLNLDVSRTFISVDTIGKTIDALAWNKFNRLHLHATDSQSWPVEIPALADLAGKGAYLAGLTYTPTDIANILEYGAARGVEVFIEFDMPGHTASIAYSYPDLITAFNIQPEWDTYANEPPSGQLKLNSPDVYQFLEKLWDDILPRVAPWTAYFHTGGDELNVKAYNLDPTVRSNDTAIIQPLLQKFVDFNHAKVRAAGLTPIVWEEMLLSWNLTLGPDVVVQTWQSDDAVAQTVAKGHKALVGNYNFWYLDCGKGRWIDSTPANAPVAYPFADYCSPTKNWRLIYSYDPLNGIPANATHLVLGGEVHMWNEQTDEINLDETIWPRASAAGEVLWSGAKTADGKNRSQVEASPRLAEMRERMNLRGINAGPVHMVFCTQNGTQCAL